MRPAVHGLGDVVVTPHVLSTSAAVEVLAAGGNAVDAAIAANAVQGVVAPETCGIGGDLFALVWSPDDASPLALNASGPAGSGASPEELLRAGHTEIPPYHPATITIPGCVAGWEALADRCGTMNLNRLLAPAIRHAERGFPASEELGRAFTTRSELAEDPSGMEMYPEGALPEEGAAIRRPRLAATLRLIADAGASSFYTGVPGAAIAEAAERRITLDDLSAYRPEWTEPLGLDVFGLRGWTIPPNSQGYLTLAALAVFEACDPPDDPDDPLWTHLLVEAYRAVAWERDDLVADPTYAPLAPTGLVDQGRLARRAERIQRDRVADWPEPAPAPGGTAYLCVVDETGLGVSLIQSNYWGIGSGIGAGNAGFILHNRGKGFTLTEGHPNRLGPGKRPLHTLSPTLWSDGPSLRGVLGTRGGDRQPQILAPIAARVFGAGVRPDAAQSAPRWTLEEVGPGSESRLQLEPGTDPRIVEGLRQRGHEVQLTDTAMAGWGPVSLITVDNADLRTGAADPRVSTTSAVAR